MEEAAAEELMIARASRPDWLREEDKNGDAHDVMDHRDDQRPSLSAATTAN